MTGFDSRNKTNLDKKYICPTCSLILRDPIQLTECGHRVCQSCFRQESKDAFKCPQCHIETSKDDALFDRGFRNEMESLSIDCVSCQWSGILKDYQKHLDSSHFHPKCEFCNQQFDSVEQLNEHKEKQCEKFIVHCILKDHGCNELIVRSQMKEHYLTQKHQDILLKCIRQMKSLLAGAGIDTSFSQRTTTTTINDSVTAELLEFYETLDILTGGIETLMDDSQRLTIEASQQQVKIQAIEEQLSKVKLSLQESQGFFEGMEQNQDIMHQETLSLTEKADDMKYVSYDGTLIWKITNFREKLRDAQSERQTSIYSPPFYSSPTGYKMRARLYLQGDGNARNSHMSLFFVLMRGPNDAILKFPFTYKVTFCLYDQNGTGRHIIDSFRPDTRSNSFQRPRSEMNIASGIPKFFPLSLIEQEGSPYVRDDTMFIKIFVDFADMARNLVPFAMNLNPGLPTAIQHGFIKQEAERRMQQEQQPNTAT